jgi:hypothetical protein
MCSRIGLVESLDATPRKGADFYQIAGHFECSCDGRQSGYLG